jgi:predicted lipoprotein with Yx(FWY)xxD motif
MTPQQGTPLSAPPSGGNGRKLGLALGIAGLVLVLVGVGAFFAIRALRGGDGGDGGSTTTADESQDTYNGSIPLAAAVTSEPEEVWSYHLDDSGVAVSPAGERTYLAWGGYTEDEPLKLAALDENGEEDWTLTRNIEGYSAGPAAGSDIIYVVPYADDDGAYGDIQAISGEDGTTLWTTPGGSMVDYQADGVIVASDDGKLRRLDPTGDVSWEVEAGDARAIGRDVIYTITGDTLAAYDVETGEETWTADTSAACESYTCYATASRDIVLIGNSSTSRATAFSTEDGSMLWAEDGYGYDHYVGNTGNDLVYIQQTPDSTTDTDGEVVFYDTEGEVGTLPVAVEDYWFYSSEVSIYETNYLMDWTTTTLYQPDLTEVTTFDGPMAFVSGGAYTVTDDTLAYQHLGEDDEPLWSIPVTGSVSNIQIDDKAVILVGTDEITRYE